MPALITHYGFEIVYIPRSEPNREDILDSKVHGANMGPTRVLSAQMDPMLAPCTLLSGLTCRFLHVSPLSLGGGFVPKVTRLSETP